MELANYDFKARFTVTDAAHKSELPAPLNNLHKFLYSNKTPNLSFGF
jgi:hypothetical protein